MPDQNTEAQAILNLQRYLRQLSYDEESIKAPPVDGIFETDTQNALRAFQKLKGLPVTGKADQETWELLYALYRASLAKNSQPRPIALFPRTPTDYELALGATGVLVMLLQYMLDELTHSYSDLGDFSVNGTFDEPTKAAVNAFQSHNVLRQTGAVDRDTWNQIADQYNSLFTRYQQE
ncbi:MAG: peptidoglycan-binding protein [Clostridia bacterium]|nr:peptidoglycan-binding protein [Clostridia bacterium]